MPEETKNLPTHELLLVRDEKFHKVSALWPTKKGNLAGEGAMGRFVIVPIKAKAEIDATSATLTGEEFLEYLDSRIAR
jgi:hypothetical protein